MIVYHVYNTLNLNVFEGGRWSMRQTLKLARTKSGMTQLQTAAAVEISERYYQHIEAGTREGKGQLWDQLEALFRVPQRQLRQNS